MQIFAQIKGIERVQKQLARLTGPQAKQAYADALTDTGFHIRRAMQAELKKVFNNPEPWVVRSPRVWPATPQKLSVRIAPTHREDAPGKGTGGKVDPQQVLQAHEWGGRRADKRSEVALRRARILPAGYQTAIPHTPYPGSTTARGDLSGPFVTQLLSYLQAMGEGGRKANMSEKSRRRMHKGTKARAGRRYVVFHKHPKLASGIWAVGADRRIQPVLIFVRAGQYGTRLDMDKVQREAKAEDYLAKRVRYRIRKTLEDA